MLCKAFIPSIFNVLFRKSNNYIVTITIHEPFRLSKVEHNNNLIDTIGKMGNKLEKLVIRYKGNNKTKMFYWLKHKTLIIKNLLECNFDLSFYDKNGNINRISQYFSKGNITFRFYLYKETIIQLQSEEMPSCYLGVLFPIVNKSTFSLFVRENGVKTVDTVKNVTINNKNNEYLIFMKGDNFFIEPFSNVQYILNYTDLCNLQKSLIISSTVPCKVRFDIPSAEYFIMLGKDNWETKDYLND